MRRERGLGRKEREGKREKEGGVGEGENENERLGDERMREKRMKEKNKRKSPPLQNNVNNSKAESEEYGEMIQTLLCQMNDR
jgi:hypothetical protein